MHKTDFTLGILGGGQLGRMSAMAAARLGISVIIFCPEKDSPAAQVAGETIIARYDDFDALKRFSDKTDVISYEFENIPLETIVYLETLKENNILPDQTLLDVSQDRIKEKTFLNAAGIATTRWNPIATVDDIKNTLKAWNTKAFILKTIRFGYDGKGQIKCTLQDEGENKDLTKFLRATQDQALIMEEIVPFSCEISVIIARDIFEKAETYGPMLNEHKNHILHKTTIPSGLPAMMTQEALTITQTIAERVHLTGVLTVEFFVCPDGKVLVNEIAPRTHNSGHWSLDACAVSQFENHVRTVCGLPVGAATPHSDATMLNLIGDDVSNIDTYINAPQTCLHLYGKKHPRKGRKMGHVTFLTPRHG